MAPAAEEDKEVLNIRLNSMCIDSVLNVKHIMDHLEEKVDTEIFLRHAVKYRMKPEAI